IRGTGLRHWGRVGSRPAAPSPPGGDVGAGWGRGDSLPIQESFNRATPAGRIGGLRRPGTLVRCILAIPVGMLGQSGRWSPSCWGGYAVDSVDLYLCPIHSQHLGKSPRRDWYDGDGPDRGDCLSVGGMRRISTMHVKREPRDLLFG